MYRFEDYEEGELPWLDRDDAPATIERRLAAGEIDAEQAGWLRKWHAEGYVVFEGLCPDELARAVASDVDAIHEAHRDEPLEVLREHFKNAYPDSDVMRRALLLPEVLERMDLVLGRRVIPHQTLSLPVSTQQAAHSDQILMTTHPIGYMAAAWFALEDVDEEAGPLVIHPGSHRLPYVSAERVGIPRDATPEERGRVYDRRYYDIVRGQLAEHGVGSWEFLPRRGDVLFWHSNLVHGARPVERIGATRRSLIAHYFAEAVEHYSDLFGWRCLSPDLRAPAPTGS